MFDAASKEAAEEAVQDTLMLTGRAMRRWSDVDMPRPRHPPVCGLRRQDPHDVGPRRHGSCVHRIPHYGDQGAWSGFRVKTPTQAMRNLVSAWRGEYRWAIPPYMEDDSPELVTWQ